MQVFTKPQGAAEKEQLYIAVRDKEGRIYTDEELLNLPDVPDGHRYYDEWVYRRASFSRFAKYLREKHQSRSLNILDIGCGNGWMSNRLREDGHRIAGLDMNMTELLQAERVFGSTDTLNWIYADVFDPAFHMAEYDIIVLAASCQYFPDLVQLTERLRSFLSKCGQIHLLDSKLYSGGEIDRAGQRSLDYYTQLGFPQMNDYYHHHSREVARSLGYRKLFPTALNFNAKLEWWALDY